MNTVLAFWQFLHYVLTLSSSCVAVTQSTHSTPATANPIIYGGSCIQAFLVALSSHGSIAWVISS